MPQVLRVVCCFQCRQFQSDIVKKSNKWTCSRCNTKQTLRKEYGRGSGRECRLLAQQLSTKSCESEDLLEQSLVERLLEQEEEFEISPVDETDQVAGDQRETTSKWGSFLVKEEPEEGTLGFLSGSSLPQQNTFNTPQSKEPLKEDLRLTNSIQKSSKSSSFWPPKRSSNVDPSTQTQSIPLMNFHQMDKQDKKQFKWESHKSSTTLLKPFSMLTKEENIANEKPPTQGFFSFKPKVPKSLKRPPERIEEMFAAKRELVEVIESCTSSEAGFSKLLNHDRENSEICANERYNVIDKSKPTSNAGSGSKWNKFVARQEEDDGII